MIHVVEDEPNICKLVSVNLQKRGHEVLVAQTGQRALEHLQEHEPELMILNIKLPDISGLEILDRMDDLLPPSKIPPVVLITASSIDENFVLPRYPRVVRVFTKPFDINELIAFVHTLLNRQDQADTN